MIFHEPLDYYVIFSPYSFLVVLYSFYKYTSRPQRTYTSGKRKIFQVSKFFGFRVGTFFSSLCFISSFYLCLCEFSASKLFISFVVAFSIVSSQNSVRKRGTAMFINQPAHTHTLDCVTYLIKCFNQFN